MNYKIIKYDPIYNDQICGLEKEIWSPDPTVNKSYLRWKYVDNPLTDSPKIYMALHEGRVIAVRGIYETRWQVGSSEEGFVASCAGDLVVHPVHRSRGVFSELMNFIKNDLREHGCQYIFSFSAGPATLINSLATGWKSIGRIKVMRKELDPGSPLMKLTSHDTVGGFIKRVIAAKLKKLPATNHKFYEELKYPKDIPPQIKIEKQPLVSEMASLVKELIPNNKLVLTRDEKFFSWRYKNPLSTYFFLYWYEGGLKGYTVAQSWLYKNDLSFNILELEALSSHIKMELLKALVSLLGFGSISIWSSMLDDECHELLASKGFGETGSAGGVSEYTPTILIRTTGGLNDRIEYRGVNLADIKNWDLKMLCSDAL